MPSNSHGPGEKILRVLALTTLYAAATAIAIAFSPANGFIQPEGLSQLTGLIKTAE